MQDDSVADLYSRVAPKYAEIGPPYFAHAGNRLVDLLGLKPGDLVLDLGTGRGAVLLPAALRVAPGGQALGIDIAPGMVEQTTREIESRGLQNARVQLMDAAHLQLESARFTHVLSSFSVFFFPDLPRTLRRPLERMAPDLLAKVQRDALERVRQMTLPNGVPERMQQVYVLARRPD